MLNPQMDRLQALMRMYEPKGQNRKPDVYNVQHRPGGNIAATVVDRDGETAHVLIDLDGTIAHEGRI